MSISNGQAQVDPKLAAEELLGTIKWESDHKGYCQCPGQDSHSNTNGKADCIVYLNGAANIFCFHQSCEQERQQASKQLRDALAGGTAEFSKLPAKEQKEKKRKDNERLMLEMRAGSSLPQILKRYEWRLEKIIKDSPESLPEKDSADGWKHIVGLFDDSDVVWIGNTYDSGSAQHQAHFRSATDWLKEKKITGQFTCPAAFKNASFSRSNDNVLHRRFLVVESDVLTKDQVGAVFKFLNDEVGLRLRAIVDTGGKSLHGWFDFPKKAILQELEVILPQLGCDPGLFKPSQPCRMPGAMRDGKYQRLIYLNKSTAKGGGQKRPSSVLPLPEVYYDAFGTTFWRANDSGGWQKINEKSLGIELLARGYSAQPQDDDPLTEQQRALRNIQIKQDVVYAAPLAGYHQGFREVLGNRILVTHSPKIIDPAPGDWSTLRQVFENLMKDDTVDQTPYLYGWYKCAYEALRSGKHTPGQCLAVAGPAGSGKSLIQNLTTLMLGGEQSRICI